MRNRSGADTAAAESSVRSRPHARGLALLQVLHAGSARKLSSTRVASLQVHAARAPGDCPAQGQQSCRFSRQAGKADRLCMLSSNGCDAGCLRAALCTTAAAQQTRLIDFDYNSTPGVACAGQ
jgi:hypothetical protein